MTHYMQELMFLYGYIYNKTSEVCNTPALSCENIYEQILTGDSYQSKFTSATTNIPSMLSTARMNGNTLVGDANGDPVGPDGGPGKQHANYNAYTTDYSTGDIFLKYTGGGYNYVQYQWSDHYFQPPIVQAYWYYSDGLTGKTFPTLPYTDILQMYYNETLWDMDHWSYNTTVNVSGVMVDLNKAFADAYKQNMVNMCEQTYRNADEAMEVHLDTLLNVTDRCNHTSDLS